MEWNEIDIVSADLGWESTYICPLGDTHVGVDECAEDEIKRYVEWGMEHKAWFIGMGDFTDLASWSNRKALKAANLHDAVEVALEESAERYVNKFIGLMKGTEGRWLGVLGGNHTFDFRDGSTADTRIARAMKAPYLGTCAFIRLRFGTNDASKRVVTCTIWVHHGVGGGNKLGSPLNKLENMVSANDADIYLIGHQHKQVLAKSPRLMLTSRKPYRIKAQDRVVACTGSFLRGYSEGLTKGGIPVGNYIERRMLPPSVIGGLMIEVTPIHESLDDHLRLRVMM